PPTRRRPRRRPEERAVGKAIKKLKLVHEEKFSLGVLIHQQVRAAVEQAVHEELAEVLGVELYERSETRRGERNGTKTRTLTGPTGPLELTLPRARLFRPPFLRDGGRPRARLLRECWPCRKRRCPAT